MGKVMITEEQVKEVLENLLSEDMKKVSRQDFSRTQFRIEELQNSLNETMRDFSKLQSSIPSGLQTLSKSRLISIGMQLSLVQKEIAKLKEGVTSYKKKTFSRKNQDV